MTETAETKNPLPAEVAERVREGHAFENDSPGGLSSISRWTCTTCGDAVLRYGSNIYGGATERTCAESVEFWKPVGS
jgi:hypothetical protein